MGSCCSAITLFTFHIYLGIFLAQGGSLPKIRMRDDSCAATETA